MADHKQPSPPASRPAGKPSASAHLSVGAKAAKSAHDDAPHLKSLHLWQAEQGVRPALTPNEVAQRKERLEAWGHYNGINPVTSQEIDNRHHTVHSPTTKPANAPQGRGKVQQVQHDPNTVKGVHVNQLLKTSSGDQEFKRALQDHRK